MPLWLLASNAHTPHAKGLVATVADHVRHGQCEDSGYGLVLLTADTRRREGDGVPRPRVTGLRSSVKKHWGISSNLTTAPNPACFFGTFDLGFPWL